MSKTSVKQRKNQKIDLLRRKQLIQLVVSKNMTIKEAGKKLGFRRSTAIMIVKKYRTKKYLTTFKEDEYKVQELDQKVENSEPKEQKIAENGQASHKNQYNTQYQLPQMGNIWPGGFSEGFQGLNWAYNGFYFQGFYY